MSAAHLGFTNTRYFVLFLFHFILFYFVLFCFVFCLCFVLFCFVLFLFCFVLFCFVLFCFFLMLEWTIGKHISDSYIKSNRFQRTQSHGNLVCFVLVSFLFFFLFFCFILFIFHWFSWGCVWGCGVCVWGGCVGVCVCVCVCSFFVFYFVLIWFVFFSFRFFLFFPLKWQKANVKFKGISFLWVPMSSDVSVFKVRVFTSDFKFWIEVYEYLVVSIPTELLVSILFLFINHFYSVNWRFTS